MAVQDAAELRRHRREIAEGDRLLAHAARLLAARYAPLFSRVTAQFRVKGEAEGPVRTGGGPDELPTQESIGWGPR